MKKTSTLVAVVLAAFTLQAQTWTAYDVANSGIATNTTIHVNVDQTNGDIFVGTGSGFNIKSGSTWTLHNVASGALANNTVTRTLRDASYTWVGTDGGGLSRYNGSTWTTFNTGNSAMTDNRVYSLAETQAGILWIGTRDGGLVSYNGSVFTPHSISSNLTVTYDRAHDLVIDANGILWIGTAGGGLGKYNTNNGQWAQYSTSNSTIPNNDVYSLAVAADGKIWVGTNGGVAVFDPQTSMFVATITTSNSIIPNNYIRGVTLDNLGRAYIGMGYGGVARVESNYTVSTLWNSSNSALTSDTIWHCKYANGKVWAATLNEGLACLDIDVSVNELQASPLALNLFPVPSTGDVTLAIASDRNSEVSVELFSATGQLVWSTTSLRVSADAENRITIPLAEEARGTYLVVVTDAEGARYSKQLIAE